MEVFAAKPRWVGNLAGYFHFLHFVFITAPNPFVDAEVMIEFQRIDVAAPHLDCRMVFISTATFNGADDLIRFYSLFAKPSIIECPNGFFKIRVGEKSLHGLWLFTNAYFIADTDSARIKNTSEDAFFGHDAIAHSIKNGAGFGTDLTDLCYFQ